MTPDQRSILKAAKSGDFKTFQELIKRDKTLVTTRDKDGSTPLHCAAWKGHKDIVASLLDLGVPIDDQNENSHWGTTALCAASHGDNKEVAEILISRGAKINFRSPLNKLTPLGHFCCVLAIDRLPTEGEFRAGTAAMDQMLILRDRTNKYAASKGAKTETDYMVGIWRTDWYHYYKSWDKSFLNASDE